MEFQRRKLKWALAIMAVGMAIALTWHAYQGLVLGRGYPYNTFLFRPDLRFGDLNSVVDSSGLSSPYENLFMAYFPFTYIVFRYLILLAPMTRVGIFLGTISLGWLVGSCVAFWPMIFERKRPISSGIKLILTSVALFLLSYPIVFSLDRANIEILMGLLTGMALLDFRRQSYWTGLIYIFPAIAFKFYPILLTALFFRSRHFFKVVAVGAAFLAVTLLSLASFSGSLADNWHLWRKALEFNNNLYVMDRLGLAGSASPWNTGRAAMGEALYWIFRPPEGMVVIFSREFLTRIYPYYALLALVVSALVVVQTVLIEKEFFRRAAILLILMALIVPSGGDYRLLYPDIALMILILLPTRRPRDLWAVGLLAFVLVPKKEFFLSFLGKTDSGYHDVSFGVLCNPPCLLAVMLILSLDAMKGVSRMQIRRKADHLWQAARCQLSLGALRVNEMKTSRKRR